MKQSLLILFISSSFFHFCYAQKEGRVEIIADRRIDSIIQIHKKINEDKQTMSGYRVQLFFGAERKKANDIKSDFLEKHPDINAYLIYQQPNYKVRVGDFRTRLEAFNLFKKISADFSSAFIVKDEIKLPGME